MVQQNRNNTGLESLSTLRPDSALRIWMLKQLALRDEEKRDAKEETAEQEAQALSLAIATSILATAVQPFDPGFNLDVYERDERYKDYRKLDGEDREATCQRERPDNTLPTIGRVESLTLGEKQREFYGNLKNVQSVTGAPANLLGSLWAIESRFSKNELSPTGCQGPMQFTRGTFAAMIKQYGDKIPGMEGYAEGLRNGTIKPNDPGLQAFRNDQKVAGYAAGFYAQDIAKSLKLDINDPNNWGKIYAAYNVGPGSVRKLMANADNKSLSAEDLLGNVAVVNPMFYNKGKANSVEAMQNYQDAMVNGAASFNRLVVAKLDPAQARTPITVASTVEMGSNRGIQSSTNLGNGFTAGLTARNTPEDPAESAPPASAPQRQIFPIISYM